MPKSAFHASGPDWEGEFEPPVLGEVILITGSRSHPGLAMVRRWLSAWLPTLPAGTVIRHGGAVGVDQLAGEIAAATPGLIEECIQPDYRAYPRAEAWRAEIGRNAVMVTGGELHGRPYAPAVKCLAFPCGEDREAWETIRTARAAGIPTVAIGEDGRRLPATETVGRPRPLA